MCSPNSCPTSEDKAKTFNERAACCQQPSGDYIYGINNKIAILERLNSLSLIFQKCTIVSLWLTHFRIRFRTAFQHEMWSKRRVSQHIGRWPKRMQEYQAMPRSNEWYLEWYPWLLFMPYQCNDLVWNRYQNIPAQKDYYW